MNGCKYLECYVVFSFLDNCPMLGGDDMRFGVSEEPLKFMVIKER